MRSSILAVLVLGACSIGTPGSPVLPIDAPPPIDAYHCDNATTPGLAGPGSGTTGDPQLGSAHHPGDDCMECHLTGVNGAPVFSIAGTLYTDPSGATPVSGATIYVHDANGQEIRMPTAVNGNFFTAQPVALPLMGTELDGAKATQCPDTRTMQETTTGGCNSQGCHADPNSGSNNLQGRIYL
jgi:hypothetical protein